MRHKIIMAVFAFIVFIFLTGCTRTYIVKPLPFEPGLTPKALHLKGPVNLINDQKPGTRIVFKSSPAIDWVGDLSDWTGQAIALLTYELEKRNVTISRDAEKN